MVVMITCRKGRTRICLICSGEGKDLFDLVRFRHGADGALLGSDQIGRGVGEAEHGPQAVGAAVFRTVFQYVCRTQAQCFMMDARFQAV